MTSFILLDVLYEDCHYHKTNAIDIASPFIKLDGEPLKVVVPCIFLLGKDKPVDEIIKALGNQKKKNETEIGRAHKISRGRIKTDYGEKA